MEEIQVGEYIRTPYNKIEKIEKIIKENGWICVTTDKNSYELEWLKKNNIKHSENIIDILKIGDYINGHKIVNELYGEDDNNLYFEIEGGFNKAKYISENDIKTIVTKEMFEANCYKVKEKL